ncbi:MAG: hypothetical protein AAGD28_15425 [Bacteroidota bacterium]
MKEQDIKKLIQESSMQTSEDFTDQLMGKIEAVSTKKEARFRGQLSLQLGLIAALVVLLSFCFAVYFLEVKPLFILAMGGLMIALNRMLHLKQQYEKLESMSI